MRKHATVGEAPALQAAAPPPQSGSLTAPPNGGARRLLDSAQPARAVALAAAILLAACEPAPAVGEAGASPPPGGRYIAASETARLRTGDMTIERGGIVFTTGQVLYTRVLDPRRGYDSVARDGDSYAALAVGPSDMEVELRRVTDQTLTGGAQGLCGADAPAYVALAAEQRGKIVTLLVFAGEEPPGPDAVASRYCGAFAYEAPDGARTRQGVLLW